ncbi:MAG: hypothetical protein QOE54_3491 [Streptosporangiaceae bacterium]|jgi:hypothetical protein|nr:hypothetical protein [Streptosporangiaceae bacterium]
MGNLYDYFAAADDATAAGTFDLPGGPSVGDFDTVATKGIDPSVQMGTLEELLTGRPYEEVIEDDRWGEPIDHGDEEAEHGVVTLTGTLVTALAISDRNRLAEVAVPWSQTEEFWGQGDPEALTELLSELSGLARRAEEKGHGLYCWWSL